MTSALDFIARVDSLACVFSSPPDSPLVRHLLTSWRSALQLNLFDPRTYKLEPVCLLLDYKSLKPLILAVRHRSFMQSLSLVQHFNHSTTSQAIYIQNSNCLRKFSFWTTSHTSLLQKTIRLLPSGFLPVIQQIKTCSHLTFVSTSMFALNVMLLMTQTQNVGHWYYNEWTLNGGSKGGGGAPGMRPLSKFLQFHAVF